MSCDTAQHRTFAAWIESLEAVASSMGLVLDVDLARAQADYAAGKRPIDVLEDYATGH